MVIFLIETSGADGSTAPTLPADRDDDPDAPDNPEKFHTPAADRSSVTRGCSSRNESTCRLRDMVRDVVEGVAQHDVPRCFHHDLAARKQLPLRRHEVLVVGLRQRGTR